MRTDGIDDLVLDLYRRLPPVRITDLLLEVDAALRYTDAFTHLRTGVPCGDRIGLLNVLLAEGLNLGLRKMAEACNTHDYWQLSRLARWHIESEAIGQALAHVVAAQGALPMARLWGMGTTASADGQFYPVARQGEAMNTVNARYGNDPGIKAYTHVNDRFAPFASRTIPATVSEAPYLLDGLTMNDAGRRIEERYADTGGFTDHLFGISAMLGYRLVLRIRAQALDRCDRRQNGHGIAAAGDEASGKVVVRARLLGFGEQLVTESPCRRALTGELVGAATLVAEVGDLTRFDNPKQLMADVGLVPSEHSSGARTRRGRITRAGNAQARTMLVEAG